MHARIGGEGDLDRATSEESSGSFCAIVVHRLGARLVDGFYSPSSSSSWAVLGNGQLQQCVTSEQARRPIDWFMICNEAPHTSIKPTKRVDAEKAFNLF